LAAVGNVVAGGAQRLDFELLIGHLGFLQRQHIGRFAREPVEHLRQAHAQ